MIKPANNCNLFRFLPIVGLLSLFQSHAAIDWSGDVTLTGNTTATSSSPTTFAIGDNENKDDVFLGSYTLTLNGNYDFSVESQLQGAGNVRINLSDDTKTVTFYNDDNNYTGTTTVLSGILDLRTPDNGNNLANLVVGGGARLARVTRADSDNAELISDTATVTLRSNGTLEFVRQSSGSQARDNSAETFGHLRMQGGTLLNNSANANVFTPVSVTLLTLTQDSYIDLGQKMSLTFGNVTGQAWTSGKTLYISDWDFTDDVFFSGISTSQLAQIKFDYGGNWVAAYQLPSGEIVPASSVPEAHPALILPMLGALIFWREHSARRRRLG